MQGQHNEVVRLYKIQVNDDKSIRTSKCNALSHCIFCFQLAELEGRNKEVRQYKEQVDTLNDQVGLSYWYIHVFGLFCASRFRQSSFYVQRTLHRKTHKIGLSVKHYETKLDLLP